jgi:hypothetical protein
LYESVPLGEYELVSFQTPLFLHGALHLTGVCNYSSQSDRRPRLEVLAGRPAMATASQPAAPTPNGYGGGILAGGDGVHGTGTASDQSGSMSLCRRISALLLLHCGSAVGLLSKRGSAPARAGQPSFIIAGHGGGVAT